MTNKLQTEYLKDLHIARHWSHSQYLCIFTNFPFSYWLQIKWVLIWHVATNLSFKICMTLFILPEIQITFFLNLHKRFAQYILSTTIYYFFICKNIQSYSSARNMQEKCIFAALMVCLHSNPCSNISYSTLLTDIEKRFKIIWYKM